jgi:UTP--glucose-1-phosphate uridylyltransferase
VIPAAGMGSRFLPATKAQPKEMLPVIDVPVIQLVVEEAVLGGIRDIVIITGRSKRAIEDHFDRSVELENFLERKGKTKDLEAVRKISDMANIHFIRQKEPLGLGHAIYCAKDHVGNEPFVVMLGDDFYISKVPHIKQLLDTFNRLQGSVLSVKEVPRQDVTRYGIIDGKRLDEKTFLVNGIVEKPSIDKTPSNIAWMGRAVLMPEIFDFLEHTKPGVGGEIQLTDAINVMCKKHKTYAFYYEGERYDVGTKMEYLKAIVDYALMRDDLKEEFEKYLQTLKL